MRTQRRPDPAPEDRRRLPRKGDIRVPKAIRVKRRKTYKRFSLGNQVNLAVSSRWDRKQRTEVKWAGVSGQVNYRVRPLVGTGNMRGRASLEDKDEKAILMC